MEDLEKETNAIQMYLITDQRILVFCKRSTLFSCSVQPVQVSSAVHSQGVFVCL